METSGLKLEEELQGGGRASGELKSGGGGKESFYESWEGDQ